MGTTAESRHIVITGDDFGISVEVNAAIEAYHRAGVLDQASLLVTGHAVEDAVQVARRNPALRVGLHLALCDARPAVAVRLAGADGCFPNSPAWAGLRYAFDFGCLGDLRLEIAAQFARFLELGFTPTYWDGHTHLHLHPIVLSETLPIATGCGFRWTRLVREPGGPAPLPAVFQLLSRAAKHPLQRAGVRFADRVIGLRQTGRMTAAEFTRAFQLGRSGTTEVYFHPGAESRLEAPEALAAALRPFRGSATASH